MTARRPSVGDFVRYLGPVSPHALTEWVERTGQVYLAVGTPDTHTTRMIPVTGDTLDWLTVANDRLDVIALAGWPPEYPARTHVRYWTGVRAGNGRVGVTSTSLRHVGGTPGWYIRDVDTDRDVGFVAATHVDDLYEDLL